MKPEMVQARYIVPHEEIFYISWIIDAAEGIGFLQTDDAKRGAVTIFTPKEQLKYVEELMEALKDEGIKIEKCESEENEDEA